MTAFSALFDSAVPYGPIVARVLMAIVYLYSGFDKLFHWRAGVKEVTDLGLPLPGLSSAATIVVQLAGGLSLLTGFEVAWGAALLAAFTVAATLLGHRFWLLTGDAARREFTTSLEHVAIVGGLILVIVQGLRGGGE